MPSFPYASFDDDLERVVPGNALEFALAALTDAFLRKHQSLGVMDVLAKSAASQAGAQLFGLFGVIAFDSEDPVVLDVQADRTSAAAVKGGSGADNFYIPIRLADSIIAHFFLLIIRLFKNTVTLKQIVR